MIRLYFLLLVLMPFWNYPKLPKFGETWTTVKIVGAATVLAAGLKALLDGSRARLFGWRESRLFLILLCWALLSGLTISRWEWAAAPLTSCVALLAYLYPTLIFLDSVENIRRATYWIAFSMLLASYSVFSGYIKYGVTRPGGVVGDPNYYALVAVSMFPLCVALLPEAAGYLRWMLALTGLAVIASVLLSASRGGFLSLAFCLIYMSFRGRRRLAMLAGIVLLTVFLSWMLPHSPWQRFFRPGVGDVVSSEARKQALLAGWEMIKAHPLTGIGVGMYKPSMPLYNPDARFAVIGHNTYVEIAAELGVPALIVFVVILFTCWRRAGRTALAYEQEGDTATARLARAIEIGIASFAFAALFLSAQYAKQLWLLVWFGLALARLAELHKEESCEEPSSSGVKVDDAGYAYTRG